MAHLKVRPSRANHETRALLLRRRLLSGRRLLTVRQWHQDAAVRVCRLIVRRRRRRLLRLRRRWLLLLLWLLRSWCRLALVLGRRRLLVVGQWHQQSAIGISGSVVPLWRLCCRGIGLSWRLCRRLCIIRLRRGWLLVRLYSRRLLIVRERLDQAATWRWRRCRRWICRLNRLGRSCRLHDRLVIAITQYNRPTFLAAEGRSFLHGFVHSVVAISGYRRQLPALDIFARCISDLHARLVSSARLVVVEVRSLAVSIHLGEIAHIVQGECVLRIEFVCLFEVRSCQLVIVAIDRRNAARVQTRDLGVGTLFMLHHVLDFSRVRGSDCAYPFATPRWLHRHHNGRIRVLIGGLGVELVGVLEFAFLFARIPEIVEGERICRIKLQSPLQSHVRLWRLILLQQPDGVDVDAVHLHLGVSRGARDLANGFANGRRLGRLVDERVGALFLRQAVIALSAVGLTFQFGNVAEVVKGKWVVRVDEVCLVKEGFRLLVVVLLDLFHPFL